MSPADGQNCQGATGPEKVFEVTPAVSGYLTAYIPSQSTNMDSVLYAKTSCGAADQLLCHDNVGTPSNDGEGLISFRVEAGVPVLIVVDGYQGPDNGDFDLSLDLSDGDTCADPVPLTIEGDARIVVTGNTAGEMSNGASNAQCSLSGSGPDIVYEIVTVSGGNYQLDLSPTSHNSVIYARSDCGDIGTQLDCDSPINSNDSSIGLNVENGETVYVFADGTSNNSGPYVLEIQH